MVILSGISSALSGYMCETCASKVLAASSVNLAKLPPSGL